MMKKQGLVIIITMLVFFCTIDVCSQGNSENWFEKTGISIRKTFDGSVNEYKPAAFSLYENHKSSINDFINADLAVKIKELELLPNTSTILLLYPVAEWHKSSNENDKKDKLSAGVNGEFYFGQNRTLTPYLLSNFAFKKNLLTDSNELKYVGQFSFIGNSSYPYLPGVTWRFNNESSDYKGLYYPYFGYEYNEIPDLFADGVTESFSMLFARLFLEYWVAPRSIQLIFDGTYRNVLGDSSVLKKDLPILNLSFNYYPGKQEHVSIGVNYKNGYDPDAGYAEVEITSLNLNVKF